MKAHMIELTKHITAKELKQTCRISTSYDPQVRMILPQWEEMQ